MLPHPYKSTIHRFEAAVWSFCKKKWGTTGMPHRAPDVYAKGGLPLRNLSRALDGFANRFASMCCTGPVPGRRKGRDGPPLTKPP